MRAAATLAMLSLLLVACGGGAKPSAPRLTNTLNIIGTEYKFELDKSVVNTGTLRATFRNTGQEIHMAAWGRLKAGTTLQQFLAAIPKGDEAFGLLEEEDNGPPGILTPGQETTITTNLLKAGNYALLCFVPAPDSAPHVAKGMSAGFEVKEPSPAPSPFPVTSDGEVTMTEYSFGTVPEALKKGKGTFKFHNAGKESHEAIIARLEPGKTFDDADKYFTALFEKGPQAAGTLPAQLTDGFFGIPAGADAWVTVNLTPGTYFLVCGEQNEAGKDHDDLGMKTEFTVA